MALPGWASPSFAWINNLIDQLVQQWNDLGQTWEDMDIGDWDLNEFFQGTIFDANLHYILAFFIVLGVGLVLLRR